MSLIFAAAVSGLGAAHQRQQVAFERGARRWRRPARGTTSAIGRQLAPAPVDRPEVGRVDAVGLDRLPAPRGTAGTATAARPACRPSMRAEVVEQRERRALDVVDGSRRQRLRLGDRRAAPPPRWRAARSPPPAGRPARARRRPGGSASAPCAARRVDRVDVGAGDAPRRPSGSGAAPCARPRASGAAPRAPTRRRSGRRSARWSAGRPDHQVAVHRALGECQEGSMRRRARVGAVRRS